MSDHIQISDYFGEYPDLDDPLFTSKITRKAEFLELQPSVSEPTPKPGQGYKHQKFMVRYLTHYDRMLLVHEPGTGKSCIIVHSAELFKREYLKDPDDPTKIKRAIILVKGKTLKANIKHEIVCKCTEEIYITDKVKHSQTHTAMSKSLTNEIKKWYDIMTYHKFANKLRSFEREEDLDEYMSNVVIYVDEAHNIPTLKDIKKGRQILSFEEAQRVYQEDMVVYKQKVAEYAQRAEQARLAGRKEPKPPKEPQFGGSNYETIFRGFHRGQRNKIVLATATPMINSPIDIIPLQNLILPLDKLIPNWSEADFQKLTVEQIEPYFRGRVSYLRSLVTGVHPKPVGQTAEGYMSKIYPVDMSGHQFEAYLKTLGSRTTLNQPLSQEQRNSFFDRQRHASNFVFPDGSFGKAGFQKYITRVGGKYEFQQNPDGQQLRELMRTEEGLAIMSAKYSTLVKLCKESYPDAEIEVDDTKGIVFVYFPDYVHGSGAVMASLALRENGYEEFRREQNIFTTDQRNQPGVGPCTSLADSRIERQANIAKRPRYALLTSETSEARLNTLFNTLNSYENRYGGYVQVILASESAREGININNAVKQVMATGSWNFSSYFQARERVFRSTSHDMRLQEKREQILRDNPGATPEELSNIRFDVETYNLASIYQGDPNDENEILREDNFDTIDPKMYLGAEEKDKAIRKVIRFIKQASPDGVLNYNRNVRTTDVNGSPECDYMSCHYEITGTNQELINDVDYTTKILYYSDEEINQARTEIRNLFSRFSTLKLDQIHALLPHISPIYIDMAIEKSIRINERMLDRLGFFGYLREGSNGVIYLEKDQFEIRSQPENTAYTSVLIGTQDPKTNSFHDYVTNMTVDLEGELVKELGSVDPESSQFDHVLNQLSLISKVNLFEFVMHERIQGRQYPYSRKIISEFNNGLYEIEEPVEAIRQAQEALANQGKKQGRKRDPNSKMKIQKIRTTDSHILPVTDPSQPGEIIYLHTLLGQGTHDQTNYGAVSRYMKVEGQIRLLKPSEQYGWRNVDQSEQVVYNRQIQRSRSRLLNEFEKFDIYGIIIPPGIDLRIRDKEFENPDEVSTDARKINEGQVCNYLAKPALINILFRLGIPPNNPVPVNKSRDEMINDLVAQNVGRSKVEGLPDDELIHLYAWYETKLNRDSICRIIRQHFERTGRIFDGRVRDSRPGPNIGSIQTSSNETITTFGPVIEPSVQIPGESMPVSQIPREMTGLGTENHTPIIELEIDPVNPGTISLPGGPVDPGAPIQPAGSTILPPAFPSD